MPRRISLKRRAARLAAIVACLAALPVARTGGQAPAPADVIATVKARVAPDTRVTVFDVGAEVLGDALEVRGEVDQAPSRDAVLKALSEAGYRRVVDKIVVLPDPSLGTHTAGIVNVSVANMKAKPGQETEMSNQLLMGTAVRVLKKEDTWCLVQSEGDRYLGWVASGQFVSMTPREAESLTRARRLVVTAMYATVRERASEGSAAVSDAVMGDVLQLPGTCSDWCPVQLPDGRAGFVRASEGSEYQEWKASRRATPENVERTARLFLGVPYSWGGTSPKAFDCSGFTKTVFRANGVELLRDASQQATVGQVVDLGDDLAALRKGDQVFFASRPEGGRITHTGIYLGDKLFIHAGSANGMVKINSFDAASPLYYEFLLKRLVAARRMTVD